jgi:hypothetical protein
VNEWAAEARGLGPDGLDGLDALRVRYDVGRRWAETALEMIVDGTSKVREEDRLRRRIVEKFEAWTKASPRNDRRFLDRIINERDVGARRAAAGEIAREIGEEEESVFRFLDGMRTEMLRDYAREHRPE